MKDFKIFNKLFLSHLAIGLISVLLLSSIFYLILRDTLMERTIDQLSSANILKKTQIETYLSRTKKNLSFLLNRSNLDDIEKKVFIKGRQIQPLPDLYKNELIEIEKLYEFKNISIIDSDFKKVFTTNEDTSYLKVFSDSLIQTLKNTGDVKQLKVLDVTGLTDSLETTIIYLIPLIAKEEFPGKYVVIKENFDHIQTYLEERTGLRNTGESYITTADLRMRSTSRFFPELIPYTIKVETEAAINGLEGKKGNNIIKDYRKVDVLSMSRPLKIFGLNWVIITEIDVDEAMEPIINLRNYLLGLSLLIILLVIAVTFALSNTISKPILQLKNLILTLSKGIVPRTPVYIDSGKDEIGEICNAINILIAGMKRTTEFAKQTGEGNFEVTYTLLSEEDALGHALLTMRNELNSFQQQEIKLVQERAVALIEGQENERKRIGRELHDGVGQLMTVLKLRLEALDDHWELREELKGLINEIIAEIRRISYNVMPAAIVDFGLEAALKGLCENIRKISGLTIEFEYIKETDQRLNFEISISIYRIVQETLNNILKHAAANEVYLHIEKKENEIYLFIKDNGKGFIMNEISGEGFGLKTIKERGKLLNGNIEIKSKPGKGTSIEVTIPVDKKNFIS